MKKNHLNVVVFCIDDFSRENYVLAWFFPLQGGNNQIVVFVFLFYIRFRSLLLKERISLRKKKMV